MEEKKIVSSAGKYQRRSRPGGHGRWMTILVLFLWDGVLLYMIVHHLIAPVYGGAFIALVSVYLGYQL